LPAELAVGLALKEVRYGSMFVRFAPETCKGLCGSSAPARRPGRDSALLARQYRPGDGYDPAAAPA